MDMSKKTLYRKLQIFACPICREIVANKKINYSELKEMYLKRGSQIPAAVTCPNGHQLIVYLYPVGGKARIRDIEVAIKVIEK